MAKNKTNPKENLKSKVSKVRDHHARSAMMDMVDLLYGEPKKKPNKSEGKK